MDTAMRDLERLEERNEDSAQRQIGVLVLAALVIVGLVVGMGSLFEEANDTAPAKNDPLADLAIAAALQGEGVASTDPADETQQEVRVEVERERLLFPQVLEAAEDRPEVEAALAAAAAELAHPEPLMQRPAADVAMRPLSENGPSPATAGYATITEGVSAKVLTAREAAGTDANREVAPMGRDGKYTLQVISYQTQAEADAFAKSLRERGHKAFVMSAEVADRGVFYRVRIGPFESKREAESYRRSFETEERMNTIVILQRDDS